MSLELQGELICSEIFASNSNLFPKTRKILMQFARALAAPYPVACYYSVISQIRAQRLALNKPGVPPIPIESVEALLQAPANVCLIRGLKTNGRRLWGCVAKDPKDVKAFGDGVCLNADMVEALEASSAGSRVERVTALFVCITYAHESMHRIHLRLFPKFHNEDTPPGISGISGAARGESGWKLEQELFGGLVGVWWTPKAEEEGDFTEILRVTVQKGDSQDQQFMLSMGHAFIMIPLC